MPVPCDERLLLAARAHALPRCVGHQTNQPATSPPYGLAAPARSNGAGVRGRTAQSGGPGHGVGDGRPWRGRRWNAGRGGARPTPGEGRS